MAIHTNPQITGSVGLFYVCYQLARLGWNVMPTTRNVKGDDVIVYNHQQVSDRQVDRQVSDTQLVEVSDTRPADTRPVPQRSISSHSFLACGAAQVFGAQLPGGFDSRHLPSPVHPAAVVRLRLAAPANSPCADSGEPRNRDPW